MLKFDVIVVGGGHAGIEAAWAAASMGASVAMVTMQREAIGRMSCNPAIGGIGKGQMVREIDALGGLMGLATDLAGIQFRMLNRSKGPAVWAPRAQADRDAYPKAVQSLLSRARNIEIVEGAVDRIDVRDGDGPSSQDKETGSPVRSRVERAEQSGDRVFQSRAREEAIDSYKQSRDREGAVDSPPKDLLYPSTSRDDDRSHQPPRRVCGITLVDGRQILADAVIITTGTFLRAIMHCGTAQSEGGRIGEGSAVGLSRSLRELGFELGRLKTGTPPRVHRDTIDYSRCEAQPGDRDPTPFSHLNDRIEQRQVDCWVTWTNPEVHELIRANLHRAPMYSGQIQSTGPRYCPSVEDKVVRFAEKDRHQVFLEPEGYDNERVYCNGISTSIPSEVQDEFVRRIPGLERARIVQHGYAVEYDFIPTHQTRVSLESKRVGGLFFAGQINGTSGYEEAAGQGLMAGVNAVQRLRGVSPFVLGRDEAYIGVMIDDLITSPPTEPYRMFTSRAEYRLLLRADNADRRLTPLGRSLGIVDDHRWLRFQAKQTRLDALGLLIEKSSVDGVRMLNWMRRPDIDENHVFDHVRSNNMETLLLDDVRQLVLDAKYSGYVDRQLKQVERFRKLEDMLIPSSTDFGSMPELRREAREKFARIGPRTLGQARRISGISPADITVLWVYLTGRRGQLPKVESV